MKHYYQFLFNSKWSLMTIALAAICLVAGCKKDDDDDNTPVASFQYEVSADNFLEVAFSDFSQNDDSHAWDFGDGNTSTEENPTHTYAEVGDYDVVLTVTNTDGDSASKTESIALSDPDEALTVLAGADSKTWYLAREGVALGVGPAIDDNQWWSFGGITPLGDRPCILDDKYIFHRNGTFEFQSNGTIFIDSEGNGGWLGPDSPEACFEEAGNLTSASGEDLSAYGDGGDYTYDFNPTASTLTLLGEGAYIGLANKTASGGGYTPISSKEYTYSLAEGAIADTLKVHLVGTDVWNFYLVSYHNEADLPAIPSAIPSSYFDFTKDNFTVTFNNLSANATSYSWDFGDGNTSSEENPVHTYTEEGDFTVVLLAIDDDGTSSEFSQTVTISTAAFTPETLSNASGKVWRLAGANSYYVGPFAGSSEWYPGPSEEELEARACQMDDEFIFSDGGVFEYDSKGAVLDDDFLGNTFACLPDADLAAPFDALGSGTHSFSATATTVTVTGLGAYIGFAKPFNGGELSLANGVAPASEITYEVLDYAATPDKEILTLTIDIAGDGTAWWTMVMESN